MISSPYSIRPPRIHPAIVTYRDDIGYVVKALGASADGDTYRAALVNLSMAIVDKRIKDPQRHQVLRAIENYMDDNRTAKRLQDLFESF